MYYDIDKILKKDEIFEFKYGSRRTIKPYRKKVKKQMYEVTYSMEGIIRKIIINASDAVQVTNIMTNMFGSGKVQIINVRRI